LNEYVDRTRQAAEEVSAMVDQSKQQGNGHVDRTRQAAEEVGAMVDPSQQQGNERMDRRRAERGSQARELGRVCGQ